MVVVRVVLGAIVMVLAGRGLVVRHVHYARELVVRCLNGEDG